MASVEAPETRRAGAEVLARARGRPRAGSTPRCQKRRKRRSSIATVAAATRAGTSVEAPEAEPLVAALRRARRGSGRRGRARAASARAPRSPERATATAASADHRQRQRDQGAPPARGPASAARRRARAARSGSRRLHSIAARAAWQAAAALPHPPGGCARPGPANRLSRAALRRPAHEPDPPDQDGDDALPVFDRGRRGHRRGAPPDGGARHPAPARAGRRRADRHPLEPRSRARRGRDGGGRRSAPRPGRRRLPLPGLRGASSTSRSTTC